MRRMVASALMAAFSVGSGIAAQSVADQIIKREEERAAATRSGQGREQLHHSDYIGINPPGRVTEGFNAAAKPARTTT